MKKLKSFLCVLLALVVCCVSSCSWAKAKPFSRTQRDAKAREAIIECQNVDEDSIILEKSLKAGSVLLCCKESYENVLGIGDFSQYVIYIGSHNGDHGFWTTFIGLFPGISRKILNDYSLAFAWKSYQGTDLLFAVSPAGDLPDTYDVPYAESEWNGITPYDSMGTEPILLCDEEVLDGYPVWIFCTTVEDLPNDYELHYGDLVVTYSDLRAWLSNVDDYMPE